MSNYNVDSYETILEASRDLEKLRSLVEYRSEIQKKDYDEDSMFSNKPVFKEWLLRGTIILTSYGGVTAFTPTEKDPKDFPEVMEFDYTVIKGNTQCCYYKVPSKDSVCPYCGKKFTLDDFYNHSITFVNNQIIHYEQCLYFHLLINCLSQIPNNLITMCYRTLGEISNICIKQSDIQNRELLTIEFISHNVNFKIIVSNNIREVTILCEDKVLLSDEIAVDPQFFYVFHTFNNKFKEAISKYFEEKK